MEIEEKKEAYETNPEHKAEKTEEHIAKTVDERKEKFLSFFKKRGYEWVFFLLLIVLIIIVFSIRTSNVPYLKDETTGGYTLGPDLDPFFFLRYAKIIATQGSLPAIDTMRYVPLGISSSQDTTFLPYSIAYFYKFLHFFSPSVSIEYAAIIFPVIFFCLALVAFFLLVRKLFYKNKFRSLIALIACTFVSFMTSMVHRMTAGIPEKECMGIFFFFLTLMFFVYAYNSEKNKKTLIHGCLAGISTGLLAQVWGGVTFIVAIVGLFGLILLLLNQANKKIFLLYASWMVFTIIFGAGGPNYKTLTSFFSTTMGLFCFFVFLFITINLFLTSKIEKLLKTEKKVPPVIITIVCGILIAAILALILFGPSYFASTVNTVTNSLLHPMGTDRITLTVAENNQPYFDSWKSEFTIGFFWLFFFSSAFLFYKAMGSLKLKNKILLSSGYIIMLFALIFSRYSSNSTLNGSSALSKNLYFGGFLIMAVLFIYIYLKSYYKEKDEFEKFSLFDKNLVLLLVWFVFAAISARGAMRLFLMLAPPATIIISAVAVKIPQHAFRSKEELTKIILWCAALLVVVLMITSFIPLSKQVSNEARYTVPTYYTVQWQRAMSWVRGNTDVNSVFAHWWDYGYWLQSIGERATVLDGGNSIGYWDHLMGRHVLTGQNEQEALEFLYAHNVTHFLIDSSEIGKYSAYSSIGSDVNYDRLNWVPTVALDETQTQESKTQTMYVYPAGTALEEDFIWNTQLFPKGKAGIGAFIFTVEKELKDLREPEAVLVYQGKQERVPVRYLYYQNRLYDFKDEKALQACLYIIPTIDDSSMNPIGAALYLNSRAMNALWVHLYLLKEGTNFKLVHSEQDVILDEIQKRYNMTIGDIVFYKGNLLGPIKIWEVSYPENIKFIPEYLDTTYPDLKLYKD